MLCVGGSTTVPVLGYKVETAPRYRTSTSVKTSIHVLPVVYLHVYFQVKVQKPNLRYGQKTLTVGRWESPEYNGTEFVRLRPMGAEIQGAKVDVAPEVFSEWCL